MSQNYGGDGDEIIRDAVIDLNGNFIVTGWTSSSNFISSFGSQYKGEEDGFLAKIGTDGQVIWINFLSGQLRDGGVSVAVDGDNNIIVAGNTRSFDFTPKGTEGLDRSFENGSLDIFITKYDTSGNLSWSRFYGGRGDDLVNSIAIDSQDNLVLTGFTSSKDNSIAINDLEYKFADEIDGFISKFDPLGNKLWGKYIGGSGDDISYGVAINSNDNIYISGYTNSSDFLLINNSTSTSGNRDIFMAYFEANGTRIWSDIVGINSDKVAGFEFEEKMGLQVDSNDNVILGSWTKTRNFLEDDVLRNDDKNAFILKMSPDRKSVWFKELIGTAEDRITDLYVDENDSIYVTGITFSFNFQTKYPIFASYSDFGDAFIYVLDNNFELIWSSYYGGSFLDFSTTILLDKNNDVIIAGTTSSFDFPQESTKKSILPFFTQRSNQVSGYSDAFLSRIKIVSDGSNFELLPSGVQVILENISIFEWTMMLAAIIFSFRSIDYYRRTNIMEFLLFTGLFLTLAANSFI
ncbi:MAG: SBBP repeat-containing protein, partial [Candidatus Heimdallarchaeota archaeon]